MARWCTYVGRGAIRFYLPLNVQLAQSLLRPGRGGGEGPAGRERLHRRLETLLAEDFPAAVARVSPLELGPPVGWPLQYRVIGPDVETRARDRASGRATSWPTDAGARHVNFDWMEPARQLRVRVDQDQARLLGLSSAQPRHGAERRRHRHDRHAGARRHLPDPRDRPRHCRSSASRSTRCARCRCRCPGGRTVRARHLRHLRVRAGIPADLAARPRADADRAGRRRCPACCPTRWSAASPPRIAAAQRARCRAGYRVELGGIAEESAESSASVIAVVPLMIVIMLTVLMFQLQSFQRLVHGAGDAAAGHHRRGAGAAGLRPAARLRRDPRHPRAARHDREERRHPDRADRGRSRGRACDVRTRWWRRQRRASGR